MKKKLLFIDRDGTLIDEPKSDFQVDSFEKFKILPGVLRNLSKLQSLGYELVMVTNQDGLGTSSFPEETFWPVQNMLIDILEGEGITFEGVHIDRSFPEDNAPTRKPNTGMLTPYIKSTYDLENSYVIGDRVSDVELAQNLGARSIYFSTEECPEATASLSRWDEIYQYIAFLERGIELSRTTGETAINLKLTLDGEGERSISTGLKFFDHMLEQIAKHALIDIELAVKGDLDVDEHHTIEDTALVLGEGVRRALGDKIGIERYGYLLPMDDCQAQVSLDLSGRIAFQWDVVFEREYVGDVPTEMFSHFFESFAQAALCNLHIKACGENEHHKIESIFKAFAKSLKAAIRRDEEHMRLPSTKGVL